MGGDAAAYRGKGEVVLSVGGVGEGAPDKRGRPKGRVNRPAAILTERRWGRQDWEHHGRAEAEKGSSLPFANLAVAGFRRLLLPRPLPLRPQSGHRNTPRRRRQRQKRRGRRRATPHSLFRKAKSTRKMSNGRVKLCQASRARVRARKQWLHRGEQGGRCGQGGRWYHCGVPTPVRGLPSRARKEVSCRALADSRVVGRVGGDVIWSTLIGLLVSLLLPRLPAVLSQALHRLG